MAITDKEWALNELDKFIKATDGVIRSYSDEIAAQAPIVLRIMVECGIRPDLSIGFRSVESAKLLRIGAFEAKTLIERGDEIESKLPSKKNPNIRKGLDAL